MRRSSMSATSKSRVIPEAKPNASIVHPKKAQGKDLLRSTVKSGFEQTILELKNRPSNKTNEEEYITGLQQEIKFLEYQLKLLKDKELQERGSLNELDNFLKDEVPLNENILAIKNKYNATKSSLEDKRTKLKATNDEAEQVLAMQKEEIKRLQKEAAKNEQEYKERLKQYKEKSGLFARDMCSLKIRYETMLEDNKSKTDSMKKMNDEIMSIYRRNEKQKVNQVRKQDEKGKFAAKIKQQAVDAKQKQIQTNIKVEELESLGDTNPLLQAINIQNVSMRKKLMLNQKQKNTAQNRIAEAELFLQQAAKDRQNERVHKLKLTDQNEIIRAQIDQLEKHVDQLMDKQLKQHRTYSTKKTSSQIQQRDRLINFYNDRLKKLEQDSQGLIQDKKELSDNTTYEEQILKQRRTKIADLEKRIEQLKAATQGTKRQTEIIEKDIVPVRNELERAEGRIPLVQKEIEKRVEQVEHLKRQVELIKEMKNLNLEEMKLVATGGHQIQEALVGFIKKWEKIKMSASMAGSP